jgi:hypothetical protein
MPSQVIRGERLQLGGCTMVHRFGEIAIIFPKGRYKISSLLPHAKIHGHAEISTLQDFMPDWYRTKLRVVAPDHKYWEILAQYETDLGQYKIYTLDLVRETFSPSDLEAGEVAQPVGESLHLKGAKNILKQAGIATISDLRDFDLVSFLAKLFPLEEINYEELGRWLNDIPRGAEVVTSPNGFTYNCAIGAGSGFCRGLGIWSAARLRKYLREERQRIGDKTEGRTPWEEALASLPTDIINSFFVHVKLEEVTSGPVWDRTDTAWRMMQEQVRQ